MSTHATLPGLAAGLALGLAAGLGGFGAFVLVLLFGAIGLAVGRHLDGKLDIEALTGRARDR